jgi:hypothetical protein
MTPPQVLAQVLLAKAKAFVDILEQLRLGLAAAYNEPVAVATVTSKSPPDAKAYDVTAIQQTHPQVYRPWTAQDDA